MSVAEAFLEETVVFVNFLLIVQLLVLLKFPLFVLPLQTIWLSLICRSLTMLEVGIALFY